MWPGFEQEEPLGQVVAEAEEDAASLQLSLVYGLSVGAVRSLSSVWKRDPHLPDIPGRPTNLAQPQFLGIEKMALCIRFLIYMTPTVSNANL